MKKSGCAAAPSQVHVAPPLPTTQDVQRNLPVQRNYKSPSKREKRKQN